ncbi:phosphoribosylglycinamide formyltransferase [Anaerocolumna cellulosilytica]|uniref:Phosphoribosylglycinamide formyltransferase n=1 Tax=Anaerocolumna cellulosilytica TaxID=433286 RepID=A0A6S6QS65_9FIRM|nr:phosphoribosylglycinamide formyltransferase [Anaerocolumna cellulosilytica]MBB5194509.1 phosphoribosylglycinamide formyltransferase-1 [Anaerocolumna cellulosilytica]BCJ93454.1 phosphoribosylglycinamide formyltransferase [Anaerocolumna cellulosilytica]
MLKLGVLVSGGGTNFQAILDRLSDGAITNTEVAVVISSKKDVYAIERAKKHKIPSVVLTPKDFKDRSEFHQTLLSTVNEYQVDLIVLAGYLVILPEILIKEYRNRIINIHPSLIPAFCGAGFYGLKVHEAVLKRGVKLTGATVHFVDEGTDTGPILLQKAVEVKAGDTPELLQQRVMEEAEWSLLPKAIDLIANGKVRVENNRSIIEE